MYSNSTRSVGGVRLNALFAATLSPTILFADPVAAKGLCPDIRSLIEHARSGTLSNSTQSGDEMDAAGSLILKGASACEVALQLDGASYHCRWKHPLRAAAATRSFEQFDKELRDCIGHRGAGQRDIGVNHPDSYDSRHYILDGARVVLSLKDKADLRSTFVFIRVSADAALE